MSDPTGVLPTQALASSDAPWPDYVAQIEKHVAIQQERHFAERFARAMELLGDEKAEVRWGGIFALERLGRRSPQEQSTVAEVLATYVRRRAHWNRAAPTSKIESEIQLIVTVLGRRHWPHRGEERPLDLHAVNLAKAHLPFVRLEAAFLYDCNFESALLVEAQLQGAWMSRSNLKNANLDGAHLEGTDFSDTSGLSGEQLRAAHWNEKTIFPAYLSLDMRPRRR